MNVNDIKLHNTHFSKIEAHQLQPGDVICTYENITTNPTNLAAIQAQGLSSYGRKENLANLIHYEIVIAKTANPSIIQVAHASGLKKKICLEYQNISRLGPGIAFVVFRPKNASLKDRIVEIATQTARNEQGGWNIKGITDDRSLVKNQFKYRPETRIREKTARLIVDSADHFKTKKGEPMSMNCTQYASNVINAATIRTIPAFEQIIQSNLDRPHKITAMSLLLKQRGTQLLSHYEASTAALTFDLLSQTQAWQPVGYIGTNSHTLSNPFTPVILGSHPLQLETRPEIIKVLKALQLLQGKDLRLHGYRGEKIIKLKTAFYYLTLKQQKLSLETLLSFIKEKEAILQLSVLVDGWLDFQKIGSLEGTRAQKEAFLQHQSVTQSVKSVFLNDQFLAILGLEADANAFVNELLAEEESGKAANLPSLVHSSVKPHLPSLLKLEKALIRRDQNTLESHDFQLLRSLNFIHRRKTATEKATHKIALCILAATAASALLISPAIAGPITACAIILTSIAIYSHVRNVAFNKWEQATQNAAAAQFKNVAIPFTRDVGYGAAPWIKYTLDDGGTWFVERFTLLNGSNQWEARLRINGHLKYKCFVSVFDENCPDPEANARWENGDDHKINQEEWEAMSKDHHGRFSINEEIQL